jgi:tetratricopeptide (TPR) repeat protein
MSPPPDFTQSATWGMPRPPLAPSSFEPGSSFGTRYRIEKLLGEGGMGAVYKAYDSELGRTIALKLVRPELATSPQTMARFKQELLLASKISHKNILRIHDLGDWNGIKFITMAFVEGPDMAGLVDKTGRLPFDRALKFTRQLCAALDAAHSEGVVHRDLKPQNILVDQADNVYISDFGLAKSLEAEATMMTRTGQILGTPRYMSPEQVEAKQVDHRSDLYSLGLILYEMFTADVPFRGESTLQLMYQRVNETPQDPRTVCPELPAYLANIILKCLEKDPAKRYQSAAEILADLDAQHAPAVTTAAAARTISIQLPQAPRRLWLGIAAAAALLAAAVFTIPATRHWVLRSIGATAQNAGQPALRYYMAVLPLRVAGEEEKASYVSEGLVDSLSAKLSGLNDVYVASANAVSAAKDVQDPAKLARTLGVTLLVRGTVQSSGDKVSITISLDDVGKNGRSLLHQEFSGLRADLLTLEDKVFDALVGALAIKRSNEEMARASRKPTENVGAYELYLRGQNLFRSAKNTKALATAVDTFEQAVRTDPRFALAYAGLASAYLGMWDSTKDSVWTQKALGAAHQAQALNDILPEVHFVLGSVDTATGRTAEAIAELQRALQLAPNSDEALRRLGIAYMAASRQQEALGAYAKAAEINPYFWSNFNRLGATYFRLGQNDKALAAFRHVTELEPDRASGYANMGSVYLRQANWNESIPLFEKAIKLQPTAVYYSNLGTSYFFLGRYNEAVPMFEKAVQMTPNEVMFRGNLADAYRWSGQREKAAAAYDQAIDLAYKAYQVNPQNAEILGELALYYAKKMDDRKATDFIQRARQIDRKGNALMYEEATIHALAGRTTEALASLSEALRNGYSLKEASTDPELKSLRQRPEFDRLVKDLGPPPATK